MVIDKALQLARWALDTSANDIEFRDGRLVVASTGEGLGNQFLSHIREVDAIVQVVRCFESADIHHVSGTIDPIRDIEVIDTELVLADLVLTASGAVATFLLKQEPGEEERATTLRYGLMAPITTEARMLAKRVGMERTHLYRKLRSLGVDFRHTTDD